MGLELRVLDQPAADAAWNMAFDEALLAGEGATLRLYSFAPHAVSIGWFQRAEDFADLPAEVAVVRRCTGGGAIHHGDDLTFALAIDADRMPADLPGSYRLVHAALIAALADAGVRAELSKTAGAPAARPAERWCFAAPGRDDVVTARGKLAGSAQRRVRRPRSRILHHGSIVLRRPALTPFTAAIEDDMPVGETLVRRLRAGFAARLGSAIGMRLAWGEPTAAEQAAACERIRRRSTAWPTAP